MKFVIDDKIPYIKGILEPFAEVCYLPGAEISNKDLRDADALIVRTRTKCNKSLLENTAVRFIASATIGFDHIDQKYCQDNGVSWTNAPGCNAESVNQYMASALSHWSAVKKIPLAGRTIGIVGVGNVGSKVANTAEIFGLKVLLNDPPRARKEGSEGFVDLRRILIEADIISLHVPLNMDGVDKTLHLINECFLESWKNPLLLINTCRGEVMDSKKLKLSLENRRLKDAIIDCWEDEPDIDTGLLNNCLIGTPHIAGYSKDGKANGTSQSVQAISKFFNLPLIDWYPEEIETPKIPHIILNGSGLSEEEIIHSAVQSSYSIKQDDLSLREKPEDFEKLRGDYPVRREFPAFNLKVEDIDSSTLQKLKILGFNIDG